MRHRYVPLWPQLEEILRSYTFERPPRDLLFSTSLKSGEAMVTDIRKLLDRIAVRAGWNIRRGANEDFPSHLLRSSAADARRGESRKSVHCVPRTGSREMVERTYGHLGTIRHRSDVVEYRVESHHGILRDRLAALGWVKTETPCDAT